MSTALKIAVKALDKMPLLQYNIHMSEINLKSNLYMLQVADSVVRFENRKPVCR